MATWAEKRQRAMALRPLFEYMEARGIKQTWLARRVGKSPAYLWKVKEGLIPTPEGFVEVACTALGISPKLVGFATQPRRKSKIVA